MGAESLWVRTIHDPIATYTLVLAIFTIVLATASIWQGVLTLRSINLGRSEFLATHRPRVRVRWIAQLPIPGGSPIRIRICIANTGETIAFIFESSLQAAILDKKGCFVFPVALAETTGVLSIELKPGQSTNIDRDVDKEIPQEVWERSTKYGDAFVVDGFFKYRDQGGLIRNTGFCRGVTDPEMGFRVFEPLAYQEYED